LAPLGAFAIVLAVYPVRLVQLTWTHLATVVAGAVLLFAPMPALLGALVPDPPGAATGEEAARPARAGGRARWWIVAAIGVGVGAFAFAGEMTEGAGGAPAARLAAVAAVFVGLATSGILVAYAFLRGPLGLGAGDGH
ncbi:MAG TPA: hypothetical protein VGU27_03745, partial [Candidatus Eisenbacteria bacterium]|nr:hypothetical protein [Candidatus Eisenbacteria bacterium]